MDRLHELSLNSPSGLGGMKRVSSTSSTLGLVNVYHTMWRTVLQLALDPFPLVNQQAGVIVNNLKSKVSGHFRIIVNSCTYMSNDRYGMILYQ